MNTPGINGHIEKASQALAMAKDHMTAAGTSRKPQRVHAEATLAHRFLAIAARRLMQVLRGTEIDILA